MAKYVLLPYNKKLNLLREHGTNCDWPNLEQEQWCLHCNQKFSGHSARVWQDKEGSLWLESGKPGCHGSPIDWAPYPWGDPKHPATKQYLKKPKPQPRRQGSGKNEAKDEVPL